MLMPQNQRISLLESKLMNKSQALKILGLYGTETAGIESTNLKIDELMERYGKEGF